MNLGLKPKKFEYNFTYFFAFVGIVIYCLIFWVGVVTAGGWLCRGIVSGITWMKSFGLTI